LNIFLLIACSKNARDIIPPHTIGNRNALRSYRYKQRTTGRAQDLDRHIPDLIRSLDVKWIDLAPEFIRGLGIARASVFLGST
jgi:hypothetical protein